MFYITDAETKRMFCFSELNENIEAKRLVYVISQKRDTNKRNNFQNYVPLLNKSNGTVTR